MNAIRPPPLPSLYDQLQALPENRVGEIIDGQLYTQPRPSGPHGLAEFNLGYTVGGPFSKGRGGPGGWWILIEPEVHFVRDTEVTVPDLAGWRRERMPSIPKGHRFEAVPDWVCEVLSTHTAKKDRAKKMPLYARFGVTHCWLVDPRQRTLEAYELRAGLWTLLATLEDEETVALPPFDAVGFSLGDLWT